jgi:hypothetical protein
MKDPSACKNCYWANPSEYNHIALREIRRIEIVWSDEEITVYENLKKWQVNNKKLYQSM